MHVYGPLLCLFPMTVYSIIVTDPPPVEGEYKYSYDIEDPTTGDTKTQHEVRRGDVVSGSYSLVDPDGTRRTVQYTADPLNGFTAVVHKEQLLQSPQIYEDKRRDRPTYIAKPMSPLEPVLYTKLSYPKLNYEDKPAFLFTPANEIRSGRENFAQGQYFQPAVDYDKNYAV